MKKYPQFKDLAPMIYRQRLVVEGTPSRPVGAQMICDYLRQLGPALEMRILADPITHRSPLYGWAGWVHWETSGTHIYAWDRPLLFVSVDIYTCKPFQPQVALEVTATNLHLTKVAIKEF